MSGRSRVAVTGLGLVTPAGVGVKETWRRMALAQSTAAGDPCLAGHPVSFSCAVADDALRSGLPPRLLQRTDRFVQMAIVAAREAVAQAALGPGWWDPARVGVIMGVGIGSMESWPAQFDRLNGARYLSISPLTIPRSVPNMAAGEVAMDQRVTGPNFVTSAACASGATALAVARDLIRAGTCDLVLAGGAESARASMTAACFSQMRALSSRNDEPARASRPFDADRDGFVLGEGAGVLVLEREEHAQARGARILAFLDGCGASADAHHPVAPHPDGDGACAAMSAALRDAGLCAGDIGHVNAHGTGTRLNDLAEARALRRIFEGGPPPVTATKGTLGHAIGGSGGIEAALTVLSLVHQRIPPTANLDRLDPEIDLDVVTRAPRRAAFDAAMTNSFGFGGQNAALVFQRAHSAVG